MTSYYKNQRDAFFQLNDFLASARLNRTEIDINRLLIQLTDTFCVSEKCILKRLERIKRIEKDFSIIDDTIVWKQKKEVFNNDSS